MNLSKTPDAKWKKPDSKGFMLYEAIYMAFWRIKTANLRD